MFIAGKSGSYNPSSNYFNGANRYGQQVVGGKVAPGDWQLYNTQNGNSIQYTYNKNAALGHRWTENITNPNGQTQTIQGLGIKKGPNGQVAWGRYGQSGCGCGSTPQSGVLNGTPNVTAGNQSDTINLSNGQQITESGDPHETGIQGGESTWTSNDRQLVLPNGNVVSMQASASNGQINPQDTVEYSSLAAALQAGMPTNNLGAVTMQNGQYVIQNASPQSVW